MAGEGADVSEPRCEQLAEGVTLWMGDMMEVLPTLGKFDACLTDLMAGGSRDG